MKSKLELVGHVVVESGAVVIGDPCYMSRLKTDDLVDLNLGGWVTKEEVAAMTSEEQLRKLSGDRVTGTIKYGDLDNTPTEMEKRLGLTRPNAEGNISDWEIAVGTHSIGGDGSYPVYAEVVGEGASKRLLSLTIRFDAR